MLDISAIAPLLEYPRGESNPNRWNRNPIFYPLNYGDIGCALFIQRHH